MEGLDKLALIGKIVLVILGLVMALIWVTRWKNKQEIAQIKEEARRKKEQEAIENAEKDNQLSGTGESYQADRGGTQTIRQRGAELDSESFESEIQGSEPAGES